MGKATARTKTVTYDIAEQLRTPGNSCLSQRLAGRSAGRCRWHRPCERHVAGGAGCGTKPGEFVQGAQRE